MHTRPVPLQHFQASAKPSRTNWGSHRGTTDHARCARRCYESSYAALGPRTFRQLQMTYQRLPSTSHRPPWSWLELARAGEPTFRVWGPPYASNVQVLGSEVGMPVPAGRGPKSQVRSPRPGPPGSGFQSPWLGIRISRSRGRCSIARPRRCLPQCASTDIRPSSRGTLAGRFSLAACSTHPLRTSPNRTGQLTPLTPSCRRSAHHIGAGSRVVASNNRRGSLKDPADRLVPWSSSVRSGRGVQHGRGPTG